MNPRFDREVQRTTLRLLRQLAAIHKMPNVLVHLKGDNPAAPIQLFAKNKRFDSSENNEIEYWSEWRSISISYFLSLDLPTAIAAGGTVADLLASQNKRRPPLRWDMEPLDPIHMEDALRAVGYINEPPESK